MASKQKTYKIKDAKTTSSRKAPSQVKMKVYTPPSDTVLTLMPFFLILAAFFITLCLFAPSFTGILGEKVEWLFAGLFSWGAYLIPFLLVARAFCFRREMLSKHPWRNWVLSLLFIVTVSAILATAKAQYDGFSIIEHFKSAMPKGSITTGSMLGGLVSAALTKIIGRIMTFILLVIAVICLAPFTLDKTPADLVRFIIPRLRDAKDKAIEAKRERDEYLERVAKERAEEEKLRLIEEEERAKEKAKKEAEFAVEYPGDPVPDIEIEDIEEATAEKPEKKEKVDLKGIFSVIGSEEKPAEEPEAPKKPKKEIPIEDDEIEADVTEIDLGEKEEPEDEEKYEFPSVSLLKMPPPPPEGMEREHETTANKLLSTLASFNVKVKLSNISKGPTVTRYEIHLDEGVRVRTIRNLSDDIALSLAAKGVRIEAPIPDKDAIGIEVPNKTKAIVAIRSLIESDAFMNRPGKLTFCIGVDVAGNPVYGDLAEMVHTLIAGTTGSGKSVCINSILMSILYKATPEEVKLILIDPKRIELGVYNGIPHLLVPVVNETKNAAGALAWAVNEMNRRYALMQETGLRNIKPYNEYARREGNKEVLPYIVIVIDEVADLMMTARDSVETSISRLAQLARAAGMHLVLGTQRPSVDIITGTLKSNIPSRIAFTVASQTDSKTIIDRGGAEKLVGKGDMLYHPTGTGSPIRVQGAFVSDSEIEEVIAFVKSKASAAYDEKIMGDIEKEAAKCEKAKKVLEDDTEGGAESPDGKEPMFRRAVEIAVDNGTISTSLLQRKLKLGYSRAARIVDMMYEKGIIGEFNGSKGREVLISREKYHEMFAANADNLTPEYDEDDEGEDDEL